MRGSRTTVGRSGELNPDESRRGRIILGLVLGAYLTIGVVLLLVASNLHGPLRYVLGGIGIVGVSIVGLWAGFLVLLGLGWGFVTGTFRRQPSALQRAIWLAAALAFGAFLGSYTYLGGPLGLIDGPMLFVIIWAALMAVPSDRRSRYVKRRILEFAAVAAVVAVGVGSTIFL